MPPDPSSMRRQRAARAVLVLLLLSLLGQIGAPTLSAARGGPGDLWHTFTVNDGLPSDNILSILVAADESLWFGTDAGVGRYDGSWTKLTAAQGMPVGRVRAIAETSDGSLWFGTQGGGLVRLSPEGTCCQAWTNSQLLPSNDVRALLAVASTPETIGLWVGTASGLAFFDGQEFQVQPELAGIGIWTLLATSDGLIYAGTAGQGIWERNVQGLWRQLRDEGAPDGDVYSLLLAGDGVLWAGTGDGLARREADVWQAVPLLGSGDADKGLLIFAVLEDREGGIWLGTSVGCFDLTALESTEGEAGGSGEAAHLTATRDGLANDWVRAMAFDSDQSLWLGTIAGLSRYSGKIWQNVIDESVAGQRINTILADRQGRTWVGTDERGLAVLEGSSWEPVRWTTPMVGNRVIALFQDSGGRVWTGTEQAAGYLNTDGAWTSLEDSGGAISPPVNAFAEDELGRIWIGSQDGIAHWTESDGVQRLPELAGRRVNAVAVDGDGALWFGMHEEGLIRLTGWDTAGARWDTMTTPGGAPFKGIALNGIVSAADGSLLVGTSNDGLWRFANGAFQPVDAPSPYLLAVAVIDDHLWLGMRTGLARWDGRSWQSYTGAVLPSGEVQAIAPRPGGGVWIGTWRGLVGYRPEATPPWVKITSANLLEPVAKRVVLNDNRLRDIRVDGGDLTTLADDLVFTTQLIGLEDWPILQNRGSVTSYADRLLAPGSYSLQVQARDADFNYSPVETIEIVVPRMVTLPGGRKWLATSLYGVVALSVVMLGAVAFAVVVGSRNLGQVTQERRAKVARQREALARGFNPYISGEPVRQVDMFFGRQDLLTRMLNALHLNSIMIHGERRMGKTSLLYQLGEQLKTAEDPEWVFVPVGIDLEGTPAPQFFHLLMDAIWEVLRVRMPEQAAPARYLLKEAAEYTDRDFSSDLRGLIEALKAAEAPRKVRIILLMDEMDVIDSYDPLIQQQLRRVFMSALAVNLGAVVAGISINKAWDRLESPWYNLFNEISLEPLDEEQSQALLVEPVRGTYEWDPDAIEFVLELAQGRPFRLQQYALAAVNRMLAARRVRITLADVQAVDQAVSGGMAA